MENFANFMIATSNLERKRLEAVQLSYKSLDEAHSKWKQNVIEGANEMEKIYIHCGSNEFKPELIEKNFKRWDKPSGLWASPEDSDWGWKDWCEAEMFRLEELTTSFRFRLKDTAKVLQVYSLSDIAPFVIENPESLFFGKKLDLDLIYSQFDAMEVHMSSNWCELHNFNLFYTWDVDSIVVWNPDIVEVVNS